MNSIELRTACDLASVCTLGKSRPHKRSGANRCLFARGRYPQILQTETSSPPPVVLPQQNIPRLDGPARSLSTGADAGAVGPCVCVLGEGGGSELRGHARPAGPAQLRRAALPRGPSLLPGKHAPRGRARLWAPASAYRLRVRRMPLRRVPR